MKEAKRTLFIEFRAMHKIQRLGNAQNKFKETNASAIQWNDSSAHASLNFQKKTLKIYKSLINIDTKNKKNKEWRYYYPLLAGYFLKYVSHILKGIKHNKSANINELPSPNKY